MRSTQISESRELPRTVGSTGPATEPGKAAEVAVLEFLVRKNLERLMDEFGEPSGGKSLHAVATVKKFS